MGTTLETIKKIFFLSKNNPKNKKIEAWVKSTTEFPKKPLYLLKTLELLNNNKLNDSALVKILSEDERLISTVNGLLERENLQDDFRAEDIQDIISSVGSELLKNEVETELAKKYYTPTKEFDREGLDVYASKSVKLAVICATVAKWVENKEQQNLFFAGLTSKIGQTVIAFRDEEAFNKIEEYKAEGKDEKEAEFKVLGFNHCDLAAELQRAWSMPEAVVELAKYDGEAEKLKEEHKEFGYIMEFSKFVAKSFMDKTESPSSMWKKAQKYLDNLNLFMTKEEWADKISILFVKTIELEKALKQ